MGLLILKGTDWISGDEHQWPDGRNSCQLTNGVGKDTSLPVRGEYITLPGLGQSTRLNARIESAKPFGLGSWLPGTADVSALIYERATCEAKWPPVPTSTSNRLERVENE